MLFIYILEVYDFKFILYLFCREIFSYIVLLENNRFVKVGF